MFFGDLDSRLRSEGFYTTPAGGGRCACEPPEPDLFIGADTQLELPSKRCLVFEDSPSDFESAKRAGIAVVNVATLNINLKQRLTQKQSLSPPISGTTTSNNLEVVLIKILSAFRT
ncbi:HAD hydrolase-like protein [Pseudomonas mandelii]|uniref:HAD hydrolase-like protein n=1 Tax=Pseudomonas mandelii TaxID=75612 RepID=UPI0012DC510C